MPVNSVMHGALFLLVLSGIYSVGVVGNVLKNIHKLNKAYPFTLEYRITALAPKACKQEQCGYFDNRQNPLILCFFFPCLHLYQIPYMFALFD